MKVAVIQPLPGIGDMIWHLPHIRAIATHLGVPVTVLTKPRSAADQIFSGEPLVRDVMWLDRNPDEGAGDHDGTGMIRLIAALRARRFDAAYLLHHSKSLAFLLALAGIPARYGYGFGVQRLFLNRGPFLPAPVLRMHPYDQATAWLAAASVPMADPEPTLTADQELRRGLNLVPGTYVAIGIGSSEGYKQWGADRFATLTRALLASGWSRVILIGGTAEAELAASIRARTEALADRIEIAAGWNLGRIIALLADAGFYVGNDTGVMNIAAAAGLRSYGLFGATPALRHSARILPIIPPGGIDRDHGMARITCDQVLATVAADRGEIGPRADGAIVPRAGGAIRPREPGVNGPLA